MTAADMQLLSSPAHHSHERCHVWMCPCPALPPCLLKQQMDHPTHQLSQHAAAAAVWRTHRVLTQTAAPCLALHQSHAPCAILYLEHHSQSTHHPHSAPSPPPPTTRADISYPPDQSPVASHPLLGDPSMLLSRANSSAMVSESGDAMASEPSSPKAGASQTTSGDPFSDLAQPNRAGPVDVALDGSPKDELLAVSSKDKMRSREASKDPLATASPEGLESMGMAVAHPAGVKAGTEVAPRHSVLQQHFAYFDM